MRKNKLITTTLSPRILKRLDMYSKRYNMPKNKIIELALTRYLSTLKKAELSKSFEIAKRDKNLRSFSKHTAGDLSTVFHRKK